MSWRGRCDVRLDRGGGPATEAAILAVLVGLLLALAIAAGRLTAAESAVDQAARASARAASIQRDPAVAGGPAGEEARRVLAGQALVCVNVAVSVELEPPTAAIGTATTVRARVACTVRWFDVGLPGLPGSREVEATFVSPVDRYREQP